MTPDPKLAAFLAVGQVVFVLCAMAGALCWAAMLYEGWRDRRSRRAWRK